MRGGECESSMLHSQLVSAHTPDPKPAIDPMLAQVAGMNDEVVMLTSLMKPMRIVFVGRYVAIERVGAIVAEDDWWQARVGEGEQGRITGGEEKGRQ